VDPHRPVDRRSFLVGGGDPLYLAYWLSGRVTVGGTFMVSGNCHLRAKRRELDLWGQRARRGTMSIMTTGRPAGEKEFPWQAFSRLRRPWVVRRRGSRSAGIRDSPLAALSATLCGRDSRSVASEIGTRRVSARGIAGVSRPLSQNPRLGCLIRTQH
jgi:hypothetical protein